MKEASPQARPGPNDPGAGERIPDGRIVIRNLDRPAAIPDGGDDGRTLWVCLAPPTSVAGALVDPGEFEGAWIDGSRLAWFRIGGTTLGPFRVPDGSGPEAARDWLIGELARKVPNARAELEGFRIPPPESESLSQPQSH